MTPDSPTTTIGDLDIDAVRRTVPLPEDVECVYVSGSIVAGFGHATSDFDIFVVAPEHDSIPTEIFRGDIATEPAKVPIVSVRAGETNWDVEYWLLAQVEQLVAKCRSADEGVGSDAFLTLSEGDFLYRLTIGVPLLGHDWLERRKDALAEPGFTRLLVRNYLDAADGRLDDTVGLLRSGDVESATLTVREAFGWVVDALLAEAGERYPAPKWRAQKLRRTPPAALSWDEYWARETMRSYDAEDAEEWVVETVELCRELMMEIGGE